MKVSDVMTSEVLLVNSYHTICDAAQIMAKADTGALPVAEDDRLVGVITDRDIAVRAIAQRKGPDTLVSEVMSTEVLYCYEDEDAEHVAKNMGENQVRRLPVLNRQKRLVGIVSIGDLSQSLQPHTAGEAIADISRPGGAHSQTH
jgi:CBS domain-containing protein